MEKYIEKFILSADSKALATYADGDINVVPVSSVKIVDGKIWLINYFMKKTVANILQNKKASLVCWKKMMGYQIKGDVYYEAKGENFNLAVGWIKETMPERTVFGVLILNPKEIHDIAPNKDTKEKLSLLEMADK